MAINSLFCWYYPMRSCEMINDAKNVCFDRYFSLCIDTSCNTIDALEDHEKQIYVSM